MLSIVIFIHKIGNKLIIRSQFMMSVIGDDYRIILVKKQPKPGYIQLIFAIDK